MPRATNRRRPMTVSLASAIVLLMAIVVLGPSAAADASGPYLTLLFSRSNVTSASNCVADDTNVARLDTVVAPALASLGLHPTGSIETGPTQQEALRCSHYKETLFVSWSIAQQLANQYGWSFVSHTATYPFNETRWSALSSQGIYDETCGSEQQITAHGLPGAIGTMAWPDGYVFDPAKDDVQACYDFSRTLGGSGITDQSTGTVAPYNESARGFNGGPCNDPSAACYTYTFGHAPGRYRSPDAMAELIASAQPSQWVTLQSYLLVTGSRPGYWDCTSQDWPEHWTYDTERYCWNDYLSVVASIPAVVTVTDPASVGEAWVRVAPGVPIASVTLSTPSSTIAPGQTQTYSAEGYDSIGDDMGDVTAQTTFTISGQGGCAGNMCGADQAGTYTVTGTVDGGATGTAQLNVGDPPTIGSFSPSSGVVGTSVAISGTGFSDTSAVSFGGVNASFTVDSSTQITATVPSDAVTGKIRVGTPYGTATSGTNFGVKPTISGFSPMSGPVGTVVTITGTGFAGATAVKFHGTAATFSIVSSTQLSATVPGGATSGVIAVSTRSGTTRSGSRFKVTQT